MSQEIVYTSAPQGLKPGSRGFCTVIATQGMARNLAERLESLSGYRHAFAVHDEHAHLNPVNYSHLKVTVGGQEYSVLSRIGDAGQDYTGRTNKLAHHVALTHTERPPAGPAYQLQQPGFCIEEWDSQTRYTELNCHRLSSDHPPLTQCTTWSRWCDAGWAGVLAQSALEAGNQTQTIIYPVEAGSSTLALVAEALQLLPEKQRWDVTFSTYFTKLPAGVDCQWRFVLEGSPEAEAARRNPRVKLIDLCADLGTAPEGPLVEAARTGQIYRQKNTTSPKAIDVAPPIPSHEIVQQDSTEEISDIPEPAPPVPPPLKKTRLSPRPLPLDKHFQKPKKSRKLLIGAGLILFFLLSVGAGYLLMPDKHDQEKVAKTPAALPETKNKQKPEEMEQVREKQTQKSVPPLTPNENPKELVSVTETKMAPELKPKKKKTLPKKKPLEDVRKIHQGVLQLPSLNKNIGADNKSELTKIYVDDVNDCELSILGSEIVLGDGSEFLLKPASGKQNQWDVIKKVKKGLGEGTVGKFQLVDNSLKFIWAKKPPVLSQSLKYCLLKIAVGSDTVLCQLSNPVEAEPIRLSFNSPPKATPVKFPPEAEPFPPTEELQLKVSVAGLTKKGLEGFTKFKVPTHAPIKINGEYRANIFGPMVEGDEKFLDLVISFQKLDGSVNNGITIQAEAFGKEPDSNDKEVPWKAMTYVSHIDRIITENQKEIKANKTILSNKKRELGALEENVKQGSKIIRELENDKKLPADDKQALVYIMKFHVEYLKFFGPRKFANVKQEQQIANQKLGMLKNEVSSIIKKTEFAEEQLLWCNKMLELFGQLEKNVTINYELFIEIEDEKVVIVKTTPDSKKN